jgi:hypothetical protein
MGGRHRLGLKLKMLEAHFDSPPPGGDARTVESLPPAGAIFTESAGKVLDKLDHLRKDD